jgi:hypothetical protein
MNLSGGTMNNEQQTKGNEMSTIKRNYPVIHLCGCRGWVELPIDVSDQDYQQAQDAAAKVPCDRHTAKARESQATARRAAAFFDRE